MALVVDVECEQISATGVLRRECLTPRHDLPTEITFDGTVVMAEGADGMGHAGHREHARQSPQPLRFPLAYFLNSFAPNLTLVKEREPRIA